MGAELVAVRSFERQFAAVEARSRSHQIQDDAQTKSEIPIGLGTDLSSLLKSAAQLLEGAELKATRTWGLTSSLLNLVVGPFQRIICWGMLPTQG